MSDVIPGDGFIIKASKFDFFFGRITSSLNNQRRSLDNLQGLSQLGIEVWPDGQEQLMTIFHRGLSCPQVTLKSDRYGTTIVRKVEITHSSTQGAIEISYLYRNHDLESIPEVTTLIPKIYPKEQPI